MSKNVLPAIRIFNKTKLSGGIKPHSRTGDKPVPSQGSRGIADA